MKRGVPKSGKRQPISKRQDPAFFYVDDLDYAVMFYSYLVNAPPAEHRTTFARFATESGTLMLMLRPVQGQRSLGVFSIPAQTIAENVEGAIIRMRWLGFIPDQAADCFLYRDMWGNRVKLQA